MAEEIILPTELFLTASVRLQKREDIIVRNPHSMRSYQHVLEPLSAYLMITAAQYENARKSEYYNVGLLEAEIRFRMASALERRDCDGKNR